jgi:hypothetical protein
VQNSLSVAPVTCPDPTPVTVNLMSDTIAGVSCLIFRPDAVPKLLVGSVSWT